MIKSSSQFYDRGLQRVPWTTSLVFCPDTVNCRTIHEFLPFLTMSNQFSLPQLDPSQVSRLIKANRIHLTTISNVSAKDLINLLINRFQFLMFHSDSMGY